MIFEVIALNLDDALKAKTGGANQIELISNFEQGGLTPSIVTTIEVTEKCNLPIFVMLRPHSKSFVYSRKDMKIIISSLKEIKNTKAQGIVFGSLTRKNKINKFQLKKIIKNKGNLKLTFHRAFDQIEDQIKGLKILSKYNVDTVLTSGGPGYAKDNKIALKKLVDFSCQLNQNIKILIGSGVSSKNILELFDTTKNINFHFGSSVRFNSSITGKIDINKVEELKKIFLSIKK